jgi:hypothetical protein
MMSGDHVLISIVQMSVKQHQQLKGSNAFSHSKTRPEPSTFIAPLFIPTITQCKNAQWLLMKTQCKEPSGENAQNHASENAKPKGNRVA